MQTINITHQGGQYTVTIEPGILSRLGELSQLAAPHARALLAVDATIADSHGMLAEQSLRDGGYDVATIHITAAETHKTLQAVQRIYSVLLAQRMERNSPVIALGGGVVGDVAGFAAATFLRGVPVIQVPSTLLAMVDAAIGGKTGVNAPLPDGGMGKNLIGAFWQPRAVIADPLVLRSLDRRHLRCGLAECIKHAMISDAGLLDLIESAGSDLIACESESMTSLIARSAAAKAEIVQEDEREAGRRALLNLGHTFAHAIEPLAELDLHHGEAVAIGLCASAQAAVLLGACDDAYAQRIEQVIASVQLPTQLPHAVPAEQLIGKMLYDKKMSDGQMRLIVSTGPGSATIVTDVPRDVVQQAWQHVGAG